jgi:hypothetical protein
MNIIEKIKSECVKRQLDCANLEFWTEWYAEGHYDCIFNGGHCDDEDKGEKAKILYQLIKDNLEEALDSEVEYVWTFAHLIFNNKDAVVKEHRFEIGDAVGVCSDCMAEFEIVGFEDGDYKAKCILLHHSDPEKSELKIGQEYLLKDSQIVTKLR